MKKTLCLVGFVLLTIALMACDSKSKREKMGAAGAAEEMADSTRLDSSVDARNRAGGRTNTTHDTA